MQLIENILSDLECTIETNENEYVSETEIYEFILENIIYTEVAYSFSYYYMKLAAAAISAQIIRQDTHGTPSFDEDYIIELLNNREETEYHVLYEYYFGKQKFLEYHTINEKTYFFGENLKLAYNVLIKIFATILIADLDLALEKVKRNLTENVKLESWCNLILGGHYDDDESLDEEKERIDNIIKGVLN